jgi:hypothetical protein
MKNNEFDKVNNSECPFGYLLWWDAGVENFE